MNTKFQTSRQKEAAEFAAHIKAMGFRAFIAESGEYGFVTDADGTRVLSFSFNGPTGLSGNYHPPSRESGTGWAMSKFPGELMTREDVEMALYAMPPAFAGKGWKRVSTMADYIGLYGASSRFTEV